MSLSKKITELRKRKGMSVDELVEKSGVPKGTLSKISAGITVNPNLDTIKAIAQALSCTLDDLSDTPRGISAVDKVVSSLPFFYETVSAGNGAWLSEGHEYEFYEFENAPPDADFALRVRGDSMSPNYNDDDIVFVRKGVLVESGQVGVFFLNGEGYMKQLQGNRLVSLNSEYGTVTINEHDSFYTAGRVVGKEK